MNTRQKGRRIVNTEAKVWEDAGWKVDVLWPEVRYVAGKMKSGDRDLFNLYDIMVASPGAQALAGIQVTSKPLSTKPAPLFKYNVPPISVEYWMAEPFEGFEEILVRWWKVKNRYRVKREWWRSAQK